MSKHVLLSMLILFYLFILSQCQKSMASVFIVITLYHNSSTFSWNMFSVCNPSSSLYCGRMGKSAAGQ